MLINDCLAFTDITAELYQGKGTFILTIKTPDKHSFSLVFNYVQTKALSDGLMTIINRGSLKGLLESKFNDILGDVEVKMDVLQENDEREGARETCRQNTSFVLTEDAALSKTA